MIQPPYEEWDEHDVRGVGARRSTHFDDDVLGLRGVSEHDESLADEMLEPEPEEGQFRPRRTRRRNPLLKVVALLLAAGLVLTGGFYAFSSLQGLLPDFSLGGEDAGPTDYEGAGSGEVMVEIPPGAAGGQIAEILAGEDVIASTGPFMALVQADPRAAGIQPGTYRMANQMSSSSALARLLDGNYREINGVTVREGLWVSETFEILAEATGHEVSEYEDVDPTSLDLPEAADGDLEGYLFPSTYEFSPDATPQEQLQAMVDLAKRKVSEIGVPDDELHDVMTKASIIQGEGMFAEDLPKIGRVIENRLEGNSETGGRLEMDSTIHFIAQERGRAGTSTAQREVDDPYNTYRNQGLPPGPINSPGEAAIRAALHPEEGDWVFFVTTNPHTGETKFAATYAEHQENVQEFLQWCEENTDDTGQC
ncbi:endolytic transglycosylase MltG [Ornithinimicrobium sp. Y1847]|uniref:endolytic transglycosylase MltG n=1 Tax=Ornithinimicrobium sp. Y1847 TaxID=3405419 RepID=UPI003B66E680